MARLRSARALVRAAEAAKTAGEEEEEEEEVEEEEAEAEEREEEVEVIEVRWQMRFVFSGTRVTWYWAQYCSARCTSPASLTIQSERRTVSSAWPMLDTVAALQSTPS